MKFLNALQSLVALSLSLAALPAFASGNASSAQGLASGIRSAKAVVDRAIAGANGYGRGGQGDGGSTMPGESPWGPSVREDLNENDAIALPILIQASSSLATAATDADQANFAFINGNIAFGNYQFALACSQMGISRSQISRSNTAALQFPQGLLAAFGPDLTQVLVELQQLKFTEGCP